MKTLTTTLPSFGRRSLTLAASLLLLLLLLTLAPFARAENSTVTMDIDAAGVLYTIVIELDETRAPRTSANFKKLCESGFYKGVAFHRAIPNYIVQAGDPLTRDDSQKHLWGTGGPGYTLKAEVGQPHARGAVAMARLGDAVNPDRESSGSQFYIALTKLENLDGLYTVFGQVIEGIEHLDAIANLPGDVNNNPVDRIEIKSTTVNDLNPGVGASPDSPPASQPGADNPGAGSLPSILKGNSDKNEQKDLPKSAATGDASGMKKGAPKDLTTAASAKDDAENPYFADGDLQALANVGDDPEAGAPGAEGDQPSVAEEILSKPSSSSSSKKTKSSSGSSSKKEEGAFTRFLKRVW